MLTFPVHTYLPRLINIVCERPPHCVLKWGFTRTFPGKKDATLKQMSELTFIRFCWFLKYLIDPESKGCLEKLKLPKFGKGCLKLSFFLWFTHLWNRLCETDWLGVVKDIKEILNFV